MREREDGRRDQGEDEGRKVAEYEEGATKENTRVWRNGGRV